MGALEAGDHRGRFSIRTSRWTDQDRFTAHLRSSVISVPFYLILVLLAPWLLPVVPPQYVWPAIAVLFVTNLLLSLMAMFRARRAPAHLLMSLRMLFRHTPNQESLTLAYWRSKPTVRIEKRGLTGFSATEVLDDDVRTRLYALEGDRILWSSRVPWRGSPFHMLLEIPGQSTPVEVTRDNEVGSFVTTSPTAWTPDDTDLISLRLLWCLVSAR